ncbi:MAG: hypothetical protein PHQ86_08430 [Dehalococcoidales bacterium]|nr:hypothetical protein [Dehalococcoidales bacterium]
MNKKSMGLIASLVFALVAAGSFYWLWTISKTEASTISTSTADYTVVEIESVKKEAVSILSGLVNKSSLPIDVPTEKMGRTNPFSDY